MNYLAHLQLSPRDTHSLVGNLMGDFRKYIDTQDLPVKIRQGINNHCRVDKFTDNHDVVNNLRDIFSNRRRRYAGIIIDVTFDHFLSRYWYMFNSEQRTDFIRFAYGCLDGCTEIMPARMSHVVRYMIKEDWLGSYSEMAGIEQTLNRMSRRIRFENNLHGAAVEVRKYYKCLERGFLEFYPQLQEYTGRFELKEK